MHSSYSRLLLIAIGMIMVTTMPGAGTVFTIVGYHAWWMEDEWKAQELDPYDDIVYFGLDIEQNGQISETTALPEYWEDLASSAHDNGAGIIPCFTLLDSRKFTILFSNGRYQATLLTSIMDAVETSNADGIHIDFEVFDPVSANVRDNFTRFISRLRDSLDTYKRGTRLYVFTLALDPGEVYDEIALARYADFLVVQGYDLHWQDGEGAGPIAPQEGWGKRNWTNILAAYDSTGVPRRKILMSVPYYGYEWPTQSEDIGALTRAEGQTITYAPVKAGRISYIQNSARERVLRFGYHRDPESGSPYYAFKGNDGWYQGWYEDDVSLSRKYRFIRDQGLGGIAVFAIGYDDGELLQTLRRAFPR